MKKFLNLVLLLFSLCGYSQIQEIFTKKLIKSNFDSIKIYNDKKGKMLLTAIIKYRKEQNEFIFYNYEKPKNSLEKEVLYTELKFDENYRLIKEKEFLKSVNISSNQLKDTIVSRVTKYIYRKNTIEKNSYNTAEKLDQKIFQINNEKGKEKEIINILYSNNDVIVSDIKKYDWYPKGNGYKFESEQFTYPRQKFIGYYKVDRYGKIKSMKGKLNVEGQEEKVNRYKLPKLEEELDERGNVVKIFEIEKGKRILKEERQIIYPQK